MSRAETISITLPAALLRDVEERVARGEYPSPDAVIAAALYQWRENREDDADPLDSIRARIRASLDDPRPSLTIEEVKADMEAYHAEVVRRHRL